MIIFFDESRKIRCRNVEEVMDTLESKKDSEKFGSVNRKTSGGN